MATTYYLLIDRISGGSSDKGFQGWFDLDGFSLDQSQSGTTHLGDGSGAGKASFGDLSVTLSGNEGLILLLDRISTGTPIGAVQVVGVNDANQTVYELTLNNILVSSLSESATTDGVPNLDVMFDYAQIGLVTTRWTNDGKIVDEQSYGWDVSANEPIDPAILDVPKSPGTENIARPTTYYLLIDGVTGDSTSVGHEGWFEIDGFSLDQSAAVSAYLGGGGVGKTDFGDLSVALSGNAGLTDLLNGVATGILFPALRIEGVTASNETVYQLTLNNTLVSSVSETAAPDSYTGLDVTFNFGEIGIVTTLQNPDGSLGAEQSFAFDVANNIELDPAGLVAPTSADPVGTSNPQTYYLLIDRIPGGSRDDGYVGWFELEGFDLNQSQSATIQLGDRGGAGRTNFGDLSVTLSGNAGLTELLNSLSNGNIIDALQIVGLNARDEVNYELTLNNILVSALSENAAPNATPNLEVAFNFGQIGVATTNENVDGSLGAEQSFGYDLEANLPLDIADLNTPGSYGSGTTATPTTYYLRISGIAGDSLEKGHVGWFELDDFSLDRSHSGSALSGLAGGGGKPDFEDLSVTLSGNAGLTGLLDGLTTGFPFGALQIVGVDSNNQQVYDLTLNDIQVSAIAQNASPNGAPGLEVAFNFGQIGLVTTSQNADGSLGTQQGYGYDLLDNITIDPADLITPISEDPVTTSSPTTYYLLIDRVSGGSTDKGYEGAFELEGFNLDQSSIASAILGGGGASKPDFSDLSVSLSGLAGLTDLLGFTSAGTHFNALQIVGVNANNQAVYDLTLNDILVSSVSEAAVTNGAPSLDVTFDFGQIGITTTSANPDGTLGAEQSFGWNVSQNNVLDPATLDPPIIPGTVHIANPTTYFLLVDGIGGNSTAPGFEGWFELDGFDLEQGNSGRISSTGAPLEGLANFGDLSVAFSGNAGLAELLSRAATGIHLEALQIVGVSERSQDFETNYDTVYELTLNNILVSSVSENAATGDVPDIDVTFNFSEIGVVTTSRNEFGEPVGEQRYGWDIPANSALDPASLSVPNAVNNAPVISSDGGGNTATVYLAENQTTATQVIASDPDGTALTYTIIGGTDASAFTINAITGKLIFKVAPDFETPTDGGGDNIYQVIVQSSDGVLSDSQTINVNVLNAAGATITGTENRDIINANRTVAGQALATDEEDVIAGAGGDDVIRGGAGADTLTGGEGMDWLQYLGSAAGVTVDLNADPISGLQAASGGDATGDQIQGFEHVRGSGFDDVLTGNDQRNFLVGDGGADSIDGGGGNDVIRGGAGADTLIGGDGKDWLQYVDSAAGVTVDLNADPISGLQAASGGDASGDKIQGFEHVRGSGFGDVLIGNDQRNFLVGDGGADSIDGGGGNDVIRGGAGADTLIGGDGKDWLQYVDSAAGVTVDLNADPISGLQAASGGDATGDIISEFENVRGSSFGDFIVGDAGRNIIFGDDGDDTISGGSGNDILSGGAGADTFVFFADGPDMENLQIAEGTVARIIDFNPDGDRIGFAALAVPVFSFEVLAENFVSNTTGQAETAEQFLIYNAQTGALSIDFDGNGGDFEATVFAYLSPDLTLAADNFFSMIGA